MWRRGDKNSVKPFKNQKGMGVLDALFVCILVSLLIGTVIPYYKKLAQDAREMALQTGLLSIRKALDLHQALQGGYPTDLKSLVNKRYVVSAREDTFFSGEYLRAQTMDAEGDLLDPFGNRYQYNIKTGKVSSGTKGYETW